MRLSQPSLSLLARSDKNIHDHKTNSEKQREREREEENNIGSGISKTKRVVSAGKRIKKGKFMEEGPRRIDTISIDNNGAMECG